MIANRVNSGRGGNLRTSCIAYVIISLSWRSVLAETADPRISIELLKSTSQLQNNRGILEAENFYSYHNFFCGGGVEIYTVPLNTWMLTVHAYGAQGGSGYSGTNIHDGGYGGSIAANISVTPGQLLYVSVGCEGGSFIKQPSTSSYTGGDSRDSTDVASVGGGGGATDIRTSPLDMNTRLIVAGGGGGGSSGGAGGPGGGQIGGDGFGTGFGSGGTQYDGGFCKDCIPGEIQSGSLGVGGMSILSSSGGGGGGYWGGGGGGRLASELHGGGGGGGSSTLLNGVMISNEQGARRGDGLVSILVKSSIHSAAQPLRQLNFTPESAIVCSEGHYLSSGYCHPCAPGTYSASIGALSCSACPAGSFNPDAGATSCGSFLCPAGTYSPAGSPECITCLAGSYSGASSASCTACPEGHYATTGSSCVQCQSGSYSDSTGSASCKQCPLGYFSGPGASDCTACNTA